MIFINIFLYFLKVYNMFYMSYRLEIFLVFFLFLIHVKRIEDGNALNKIT